MTKLKTRDLLKKILTKMGCKCYTDKDQISFGWQGGSFCADVKNELLDVTIWYDWAEFDSDGDDVCIWMQVINEANEKFHATAVYCFDETEGKFCIHNKVSFVLHPKVQDKELLVSVMLDRLFVLRRYIETRHDVMSEQEMTSPNETSECNGSTIRISDSEFGVWEIGKDTLAN